MASKGSGTQGNRYLLSLASGLCRGPIDELIEINVGDKQAWSGHACSNVPQQIAAPDLFGGDDKEGGIEGPFAVYMGEADQVLPGPVAGGLPGIRESIGGLVSQMRGTVVVWFDGMVSAMNPYLKTWKFRVRRSTKGWHGGVAWYPEKATIYLGGDNLSASTNRPNDYPVTTDTDAGSITFTFTRNPQEGDSITVNGVTINYIKDGKPEDLEIVPGKYKENAPRGLANYINARSSRFKATATYTTTTVTLVADKAMQDIYAMNAAHIVLECFTNPLWGRGLPMNQIDENSFIYSANTLCSEGFGIALIWYRKEDIDVFIQKICNLVGGVTYTDRETGLICFRLIRSDYVIADLPHFTPETGLLSIDEDDSASSDNSYNEIIGTSRDPVSNLDFQVRAQNLAAFQSQQAVSSLDQDYKGIPTKKLLQRVVLRDLRAMASGLKKYTVTLDRRAWRVAPGSVLRISHPGRGLANVVLRVGEIDDGDMLNGKIKIKCAIDVFGLPATAYQGQVDTGWAAPSKVATPALDERLIEAGYRDLYINRGAADADAAHPTSAFIGQLATQPNTTSLEYDLLTRADGEDYADRGRGPFTGNARLGTDIAPLQTEITINSLNMFDADNVGQALLIDDELVRLDVLDPVAGTATITRGVGDTIPAAHDIASEIWTIDDDLVSDQIEYTMGETVHAKVLTRTSSQLLDPGLALEQSVTLVARHNKPYPPAAVTVNGDSIYGMTAAALNPVLVWAERNRVTQADKMVGYTEATVAPEVGQTYTIRVYDNDGTTLLHTESNIIGTTWTYDDATQALSPPSGSSVWIELESQRDGAASWQHYRFRVALKAGWGYGWGTNWGGA